MGVGRGTGGERRERRKRRTALNVEHTQKSKTSWPACVDIFNPNRATLQQLKKKRGWVEEAADGVKGGGSE